MGKPHTVLGFYSQPVELVRGKEITVERGETLYTMDLRDEDVELLARGICSVAVSRSAFGMLEWKRQAARALAHDLAPPPTPQTAAGRRRRPQAPRPKRKKGFVGC